MRSWAPPLPLNPPTQPLNDPSDPTGTGGAEHPPLHIPSELACGVALHAAVRAQHDLACGAFFVWDFKRSTAPHDASIPRIEDKARRVAPGSLETGEWIGSGPRSIRPHMGGLMGGGVHPQTPSPRVTLSATDLVPPWAASGDPVRRLLTVLGPLTKALATGDPVLSHAHTISHTTDDPYPQRHPRAPWSDPVRGLSTVKAQRRHHQPLQ